MTTTSRAVEERGVATAPLGPVGLGETGQWLYVIGLVLGFVHLVDVVSANAESAGEFVPAAVLWLGMIAIHVLDRRLLRRWTPWVLILISHYWILGGLWRHVRPLVTTGVEPAAVTGAFSTVVGIGFVVLAVRVLLERRRLRHR